MTGLARVTDAIVESNVDEAVALVKLYDLTPADWEEIQYCASQYLLPDEQSRLFDGAPTFTTKPFSETYNEPESWEK